MDLVTDGREAGVFAADLIGVASSFPFGAPLPFGVGVARFEGGEAVASGVRVLFTSLPNSNRPLFFGERISTTGLTRPRRGVVVLLGRTENTRATGGSVVVTSIQS